MNRLLAQLDREDARTFGRRRSPGDLRRRVVAVVVALVLAATLTTVVGHRLFGLSITAQGLQRRTPLGRPPVVPHGVGSFEFTATQPHSAQPVTYDPCRAIHYVANESLAPSGGRELVAEAVQTISLATGLQFVSDGTTDELPRQRDLGLAHQAAPVLITWTTPELVHELAGRVAGLGGSAAVTDELTRTQRYVTGQVALDAPQLSRVIQRPSGPDQVRAIVIHELGHLVGLAHVDDPRELMYAENVGQTSLGPGDREGLAALGSGHCFP